MGLFYLYLDGGDWSASRFGRFNPWKKPEWPMNRKRGRSQRISAGLGKNCLVPDFTDSNVIMPKTLYTYVGLQACMFVCVQVSLLLFNDASSAASVVQYRMAKKSWTKNWTACENSERGVFYGTVLISSCNHWVQIKKIGADVQSSGQKEYKSWKLIIQLQYFLYKYCMWVDILSHTTEARDAVNV
jgi:hypothetical protein